MTTEKPKPHTNIFGNVEKVVSIGTVRGSVFVSTAADDEPFSKSKAFQLGYHLGALDFFVSYQKRDIPLSPLLPNWIEEAQNRCAILANAIGLIVPEVPEHYFDSMSEQLSAKPLVIKKCFHIGNIIGRGWFFGVSPMQAGVIPSDEFVLERLEQAENLLGEADLPNNLLSTIRQIWEKAISIAKTGQFAGNDKTDGEMNQAIEGIIKTIEKYKSSSHTENAMTAMKMVETKNDKIITIDRQKARFGITLGWQLSRYEAFYDVPIPGAKAVADAIMLELKNLLEQDLVDVQIDIDARRLISHTLSHYSTRDIDKHAAILIGISAMRTSFIGRLSKQEDNTEMENLAYSALLDIDPGIIKNKKSFFDMLLLRKPNNITEVLQVLDDYRFST